MRGQRTLSKRGPKQTRALAVQVDDMLHKALEIEQRLDLR